MQTDPEELARLEHQTEEQRKKDAELRKQAEIEEAQRRKTDFKEESCEPEDDEDNEELDEEEEDGNGGEST